MFCHTSRLSMVNARQITEGYMREMCMKATQKQFNVVPEHLTHIQSYV